MNSEFHKIDLNRIRYSIVWEDYQSFYNGLRPAFEDELIIITSAGCNVLNALLKNPKKIHAVDINPYQNKLLEFKLNIYKNADYEVYSILLGLNKEKTCTEAFEEVRNIFNKEEQEAWASFFEQNTEGLLSSGQLERYIHQFYFTLNKIEAKLLDEIFESNSVQEQVDKFEYLIKNTGFESKFKLHFDDAQLSKGRDPRLFKYAEESGGTAFYNRLVKHVYTTILKNNFYMYFFFYGLKGINKNILPPCYKEENFNSIKNNSETIEMHTMDVIDYIEKNSSTSFSKASLSNIFEYTSTEEFEIAINTIKEKSSIKTLMFWNLLHEQGNTKAIEMYVNKELSSTISNTESCFYFKNVRVLNF